MLATSPLTRPNSIGAVSRHTEPHIRSDGARVGSDRRAGRGHEVWRLRSDWPAFADSIEALQYLKRHCRLAILSNVDRAGLPPATRDWKSISTTSSQPRIFGSYKPNDRNFDFMIRALEQDGVGKSQILHTAQSLFHDHVPANRVGLASAWINRRAGRDGSGATLQPSPLPHFDFEFGSLAGLAEAHRRETAASTA